MNLFNELFIYAWNAKVCGGWKQLLSWGKTTICHIAVLAADTNDSTVGHIRRRCLSSADPPHWPHWPHYANAIDRRGPAISVAVAAVHLIPFSFWRANKRFQFPGEDLRRTWTKHTAFGKPNLPSSHSDRVWCIIICISYILIKFI